MTIALDMFREQRGARHPAWLLSQTLCYLRHLEQAGQARREIDGELQFWRTGPIPSRSASRIRRRTLTRSCQGW